MRPEPIPHLKGKAAKEFEKKVAEPSSEATIKTFQKARKVYAEIKQL